MTDDEKVDAFGKHTNDCDRCRPHRGHVPFGLCPVGLHLFFGMNLGEEDNDDRPAAARRDE